MGLKRLMLSFLSIFRLFKMYLLAYRPEFTFIKSEVFVKYTYNA